MRYVQLKPEEKAQLNRIIRTDKRYRVRNRAHSLLLSAQGKTIEEIAQIFEVNRYTVSTWLDRWERQGWAGLEDAPRRGRGPKLEAEEKKSSLK